MKLRKILIYIFLVLMINCLVEGHDYAGDIFTFSMDARTASRGKAWSANSSPAYSPYYNPALLQSAENLNLSASHSYLYEGLVNLDYFGSAYRLEENFNLGSGLFIISGDGIPITTLPDTSKDISSDNRPQLVERSSHYTILFLPTFSYSLLENIYVGFTPKCFYRKVYNFSATGLGADLGAYWAPFSYLSLGLKVSNFTTTNLWWNNGKRETVYPNYRIGFKMDKKFSSLKGKLLFVGDFNYLYEEKYSSSHFGLGYIYQDLLTFNLGISKGDLTFGAGFKVMNFSVNAAYVPSTQLEPSYRLSISYEKN